MRLGNFAPDTLGLRFVATIVLVVSATIGLNSLFSIYGGVWSKPTIQATGLLDQAVSIMQILEVAPPFVRPSLAASVRGHGVSTLWYPAGSAEGDILERTAALGERNGEMRNDLNDDVPGLQLGSHLLFASDGPTAALLGLGGTETGTSYYLSAELSDRSWVVLCSITRSWGLKESYHRLIQLTFLVFSIIGASILAARLLARPINRLAAGVRRFGADPNAPPLEESGPRELRAVIRAFNDMQGQIQRFVADRTEMLAAISHDLRTPLTRIRLRAELMEDAEQRRWLFRNVDDMQAMVDSALSFFRDDLSGEQPTKFDLPELLQSIADDYNDQSVPVGYDGPSRITFFGRPYALKRAFVNLVENAIKYATPPTILLVVGPRDISVSVLDEGAGIPADKLQAVFTPFLRLERSRSRATGGVGLGLTAARSIVRAHGGDILLQNRPTSGLAAMVVLPSR